MTMPDDSKNLSCSESIPVSMHVYLSTSHPRINWKNGRFHQESKTSTYFFLLLFLMKSVFLKGKSMVMYGLNKGILALSVKLFSPNHTGVQCLLYSSAT